MNTKLKKIAAILLAIVIVVALVPGQFSAKGAEEERYSIMLDDQQYAKVGDRLTVKPKLYRADSNGSFSEIEIDESVFSFSWKKGIWSEENNEYVYGDILSTDVDFVIDSVDESDICTDEVYVAFRCVVSKDGKEVASDEFVINPWEEGYSAKVNPVFANEGDSVTFTVDIYDKNNEKIPEDDAYWGKHELVWYKCTYEKNSYTPQFEELGKGKSYTTIVKAEDIYHVDNNIFTEFSCQIMEGDIVAISGGSYIYQKGESFRAEQIKCTAQVGDKVILTANIYNMETEERIIPSECGLEVKWRKISYDSSTWDKQVEILGTGDTCEIASITEEDFSGLVSYEYELYKNDKKLAFGYVSLVKGENQQPSESTTEETTTSQTSEETTTPQTSEETTTPQTSEETTTPQPSEETTSEKLQETDPGVQTTTKVSDTQQTTVSTSQTDKNGTAISAPGKVKNFKVKKQKNRKLKLTWKKMKKVSGYQVFYTTNKKFTKGVKKVRVKANAKGITIRKLKKKKTYYIKMRAYNKVGKRIRYGAWTKTKKVKLKK